MDRAYFPADWREFLVREDDQWLLRLVHGNQGVISLRALLSSPDCETQGFLGIRVTRLAKNLASRRDFSSLELAIKASGKMGRTFATNFIAYTRSHRCSICRPPEKARTSSIGMPANNWTVQLITDTACRKLCRVWFGSDGSYYVTAPYHNARSATIEIITAYYERRRSRIETAVRMLMLDLSIMMKGD